MKRIAPLAPALSLAIAACNAQTPPPASAQPEAPGTQCDANRLGAFVGKSADNVTADAQRASGAKTVRRYETGAALTMDFRADRLNVETDATGKVVKFSCG